MKISDRVTPSLKQLPILPTRLFLHKKSDPPPPPSVCENLENSTPSHPLFIEVGVWIQLWYFTDPVLYMCLL